MYEYCNDARSRSCWWFPCWPGDSSTKRRVAVRLRTRARHRTLVRSTRLRRRIAQRQVIVRHHRTPLPVAGPAQRPMPIRAARRRQTGPLLRVRTRTQWAGRTLLLLTRTQRAARTPQVAAPHQQAGLRPTLGRVVQLQAALLPAARFRCAVVVPRASVPTGRFGPLAAME